MILILNLLKIFLIDFIHIKTLFIVGKSPLVKRGILGHHSYMSNIGLPNTHNSKVTWTQNSNSKILSNVVKVKNFFFSVFMPW